MSRPTVIITGAAVRLGKTIAEAFFRSGCNLVLHYNQSTQAAKALKTKFNQMRACSCEIIQADLNCKEQRQSIIEVAIKQYGRLDHLINNASIFYPTPVKSANLHDITPFIKTNLIAPLKLAQQAAPELKKSHGSIVNLIDIYAKAGLSQHSFYVASKAALLAATKQLALELAPKVRVNGVSPGAILWPEQMEDISEEESNKRKAIIDNCALKKLGQPENIAATTVYLALNAGYTTGSIINVDGGRRSYI